jgi:hypothetical protein
VADDNEKRRALRSGLLIEVQYEGLGTHAQTRIADISLTGVFVETLSPPPVGSPVNLAFSLPGGYRMEVEGIVRHIQHGIGMGVEFTQLKPEDAEYLRSFAKGPAS